jgi:hypothetical protein
MQYKLLDEFFFIIEQVLIEQKGLTDASEFQVFTKKPYIPK